MTEWQRTGNNKADALAKKGAQCHPCVAEIARKHELRCRSAALIGRYLARVSAELMKYGGDSTPDRSAQHLHRVSTQRKRQPPVEHRHEVSALGNKVVCWKCARSALTVDCLRKQVCIDASSRTHTLWSVGDTAFCTRCGARSKERVRLLRAQCTGAAGSASRARELARMKLGYEPGKAEHSGPPKPDVAAPYIPVCSGSGELIDFSELCAGTA